MKKQTLVGCVAAVLGFIGASFAHADTLDTVKKRGKLVCGVSLASPGFAAPNDKGRMEGFDADICRAVAAAVFGDGEKVEYIPTNINTRFQALQSGEIDILSRQTTVTFTREASLGIDFGPVVFYDGQGLMVSKSLGVKSAAELKDAAICTLPGTTTAQNLTDFFSKLGAKFEIVVFESPDENRAAFFSGRCDAISSDRSDLASIRAVSNKPDDYVVLPETISKEPLAPGVRQNDSNWRDIVSWSVWMLMAAEEKGITKANVDEKLKSEDPEVLRMLGASDNLGEMLKLDKKWGYNIIKSVGNYGEVFDRALGEKTSLGMTRGPNTPWNAGGLLYAPPFR
jgi:general L-amino acid transport system substrate-binding protein